jgi:hypothetical protein
VKAISVFPGKPGSVHLTDLDKPSINQVPNSRGVLENYGELFKKLTSPNGAIKVFCQVAEV